MKAPICPDGRLGLVFWTEAKRREGRMDKGKNCAHGGVRNGVTLRDRGARHC